MKTILCLAISAVLISLTLPQTNAAPAPSQDATEPKQAKVFEFSGGNLMSFINEIKSQLGIDLWQHGTVPKDMWTVAIPKMRLGDPTLFGVLNLYNQIAAEGDSAMGHWIIKGVRNVGNPDVVALVSPRQKGTPASAKLILRAFSLKGIGPQDQALLMKTIDDEANRLRHELEEGVFGSIIADQAVGRIRYHQDSDILIASGDDTYVNLVQSLVDAFRERAGAGKETKTPPAPANEGSRSN